MRTIVSGIVSLIQYLGALQTKKESYRPQRCPSCGKSGLWHHGCYLRKADYEHVGSESLNPIPILRFYCPHCHRTCSVLPESIPPRRHYPWSIQEQVFRLLLAGKNYREVARDHRPHRRTLRRWYDRFTSQFKVHTDHLRSRMPKLGRQTCFKDFWQALLDHRSLSAVMLNLNAAGLPIP